MQHKETLQTKDSFVYQILEERAYKRNLLNITICPKFPATNIHRGFPLHRTLKRVK